MKIAVSADSLSNQLTGIGKYTLELFNHLKKLPELEEIYLYKHGKMQTKPDNFLHAKRPQFLNSLDPLTKKILRYVYHRVNGYVINYQLRKLEIDIYHATNFIINDYYGKSSGTVATIHDFSVIHHPEHHPADRVKFMVKNLPHTIEKASHLITVSKFVKDELIKIFGINENRVTAIYNGVSSLYVPKNEMEINSSLNKYHLNYRQYLLAVSTLEPRKNFINLFHAYDKLSGKMQERFPLVLIGSSGWNDEEIQKKIAAYQSKNLIKYLGYLPEADLRDLFAGARGFVYPSLYEGFGLPIIEAMACGTPTLTSNCSSMPEVAGDIAILVDPNDVTSIYHGIVKLLEDDVFCENAAQEGVKHAAKFTWENCANQTLEVYKKVLGII